MFSMDEAGWGSRVTMVKLCSIFRRGDEKSKDDLFGPLRSILDSMSQIKTRNGNRTRKLLQSVLEQDDRRYMTRRRRQQRVDTTRPLLKLIQPKLSRHQQICLRYYRKKLKQLSNDYLEGEYDVTDLNLDELDGKHEHVTFKPIKAPTLERINHLEAETRRVFFDIETSSLSLDCEILQISAKHGGHSFNLYITPTKRIDGAASEVTGLSVINNKLCLKGAPVHAITREDGAKSFIGWLEGIGRPLILYGHNCKTFDCPRLLLFLRGCNRLDDFARLVVGFVDTLHLFRALFPDQKSHRQESLVSALLGTSYDAHNALEDVKGLNDLIDHVTYDVTGHLDYSFTTDFAIESMDFSLKTCLNLRTLNPLVRDGALSKYMARKIALSGLTLQHLNAAFARDADDGIRNLFTMKNEDGEVRVTESDRIIRNVQQYFTRANV